MDCFFFENAPGKNNVMDSILSLPVGIVVVTTVGATDRTTDENVLFVDRIISAKHHFEE